MRKVLGVAALFSMCAAPAVAQSTVVDSVRAAAVPPVTDADEGSYLLNPGDTIDIKFISNPELNELVQIRPDGRISMPLVGELLVARATIGMLAMVGRQTALGAVMEAGGFKPSAARDEVLVIRRGDQDAPRLLRLSMQHSAGQAAEAANFNLQPLDIVLVTESGVARTGRAVDQYVRQMIPVSLTGGFSWLLGRGVLGGTK